MPEPDDQAKLLYLHIPRTAGSSVRSALTSAYDPIERTLVYEPGRVPGAVAVDDLGALDETLRSHLRLVFGTFPYGIHEHLDGPSRYVTMLRAPLDRVVSLYRSQIGRSGVPSGPTLLEWLEQRPVGADNGMVRLIGGRDDHAFGHCPDSLLQDALDHIQESFDAVLVRGRMPQARETLRRLTGRELPPFGRENTTRASPSLQELDTRTRARLEDLNRLDMAFFLGVSERLGEEAPATRVPVSPAARAGGGQDSPVDVGSTTSQGTLTQQRRGPASARSVFIGDRTLLLMHIAKTGGTSLREALKDSYSPPERLFVYDPADLAGAVRPDEFADVPEVDRERLRLIMGHFRFGFHRPLGRPYRYVAIIRDPVDRVVSLYYHYLHGTGLGPGVHASREQALIRENELSLEEWALGQQRLTVDNGMTRHIAARAHVRFGECPDDLLDEALEHVDKHFAALLVTDQLGRSGPLLQELTGRPVGEIGHENATTRRPPLKDIDPGLLMRIRELNRLDLKLYELASERLAALV